MFGGIEAGGTKFVCAIGTGPDDIVRTAQFPTSAPEITVSSVVEFFKTQEVSLSAVGMGAFGPLDLDPSSETYGHIKPTPKPGWGNYDLLGAIQTALDVPAAIDTDVNAALLGEARWGAARNLTDAVYITVGTGVGGGALAHGQVIHGLVHPEMGHLRIPHDLTRDPFSGICPSHGDCLEGLASGPAIQARWGAPPATLPATHPAWELEAHYLALGVMNIVVTLSPRRIIVGGGVMQQMHLFPLIRAEFIRILNNYVRHPDLSAGIDEYIQPPQLGSRAGVLGAFVLANEALKSSRG